MLTGNSVSHATTESSRLKDAALANKSAAPSPFSFVQAQPASIQTPELPKPAPMFSFEPQLKSVDHGKPVTPSTEAPTTKQSHQPIDIGAIQAGSSMLGSRQVTDLFHLQSSEKSTTPQGSPKRPQLNNFKPPSVTQVKPTPLSQLDNPDSATTRTDHTKPGLHLPANVPTTVVPTPQPLKSQKPVFTDQDRARLIKSASRLLLTQRQGLIEFFVSHHVSNILQNLVRDFTKERHDQIIGKFLHP